MTVKDLQNILCGRVILYEGIPDAAKEDMLSVSFLNMYSGMSQDIPDEYLRREVFLVGSEIVRQRSQISIQLYPANAGSRIKKKEHRKSPA